MLDEDVSETPTASLPDGEYAVVECLGHRTLIGRVEEVERFGTKMLSIEPIYRSQLLPAMLVGGGSLYAFTPCSKEIAAKQQPKEEWQLPPNLRATLSAALLTAPEDQEQFPAPAFLDGLEG